MLRAFYDLRMIFENRIELTHSTIFYSQTNELNRTIIIELSDYTNVYVITHTCNIPIRVHASTYWYGTPYRYGYFSTPYDYSHKSLIIDTRSLYFFVHIIFTTDQICQNNNTVFYNNVMKRCEHN